jgi:hypothetical protein
MRALAESLGWLLLQLIAALIGTLRVLVSSLVQSACALCTRIAAECASPDVLPTDPVHPPQGTPPP